MNAKENNKKEAKRISSKAKVSESNKSKGKSRTIQYVEALAVMIAILLIAYFAFSNFLITPFSTFASNFHSSPRVAVAVTFVNESEYVAEYPCFTKLIESIAYTRNATTIDFFLLNSTNCTYPISGLGKPTQIGTTSKAKCLAVAKSEPSIFMNYSSYNNTIITPYHLYIYGNSGYMSSCPIAAELT